MARTLPSDSASRKTHLAEAGRLFEKVKSVHDLDRLASLGV